MLLYVFLLVVVGVPLFFMELAAGQSIRQGSIGVWKHISPKLGGIGYSSCMVSIFFVSFFFCLRPFSVYVHVSVYSDRAAVVWQLTCFFQVWVSKVAPRSVFLISSPSLIWAQSCIRCHRLYHLSVNNSAMLDVCVYTQTHPCCNMRKVVCCTSVLAVGCVTSWDKHRVPKNVFVRTHNRNVRLDSLCFL